MANKFDGDVRPLSNDPRYMGAPFQGPIDLAIRQAQRRDDHGECARALFSAVAGHRFHGPGFLYLPQNEAGGGTPDRGITFSPRLLLATEGTETCPRLLFAAFAGVQAQ